MKDFLYSIKKFYIDLFCYPIMQVDKVDYEAYWNNKKKGSLGMPNSFQIARANWISGRIKENCSILDVGCGDGSVLIAIRKNKKISAIGADCSTVMLEFLEKQNITANFLDLSKKNSIESLPTKDHYLVLEVLEHFPNPEEFLRRCLERVGESVFVSVPNTGYISHRLRLLFGKFPLQWRAHPSEHLRFWTVADFKWWVDQLNLTEQTEIGYYAGFPILNKIFPNLFAQGIIACFKRPLDISRREIR